MATIDKYLNLITSEHKNPKYLAMLSVLLDAACQNIDVLNKINFYYDIDTAYGKQLDVLGEWIGLSRQLKTPLTNVYFSFGVDGLGFGQGIWLGKYDPVEGVVSLDDEMYRRLLKIKIKANSWDGTTNGANSILSEAFNDEKTKLFIVDNQDMSITMYLVGPNIDIRALSVFRDQVIPLKSMGVKFNGAFSASNGKPLFGFGINNELIGGFGVGAWSMPYDK